MALLKRIIKKAGGVAAFPIKLKRSRKKASKAKPHKRISRARAKEISATKLSRPSQKQLGWLSKEDYKDVMKVLKGKRSK